MRTLTVLSLVLVTTAGCASAPEEEPSDASPAPNPAPASPTPPAPTPTPTAIPTAAPAPALPSPSLPPEPAGPPRFETSMQDGAFRDARIEIAPLTTVTWKNVDNEVHSVIGEVGIWLGSGPVPPGSEFSHTFEKPGEYRFTCRYHAGMAGVVVVR